MYKRQKRQQHKCISEGQKRTWRDIIHRDLKGLDIDEDRWYGEASTSIDLGGKQYTARQWKRNVQSDSNTNASQKDRSLSAYSMVQPSALYSMVQPSALYSMVQPSALYVRKWWFHSHGGRAGHKCAPTPQWHVLQIWSTIAPLHFAPFSGGRVAAYRQQGKKEETNKILWHTTNIFIYVLMKITNSYSRVI